MKILVLNSGSNSLKFELIEADPNTHQEEKTHWGSTAVSGTYDNVGKPHSTFSLMRDGQQLRKEETEVRDYGHAAELLFDWIEAGEGAEYGIGNVADIERIGHRVVHGADLFDGPVTDRRRGSQKNRTARGTRSAAQPFGFKRDPRIQKTAWGQSANDRRIRYGVSPRRFRTKPRLYAIPPDIARRHKIRRYGFHGISHRYMAARYAQLAKRPLRECKLITLAPGGWFLCRRHSRRGIR